MSIRTYVNTPQITAGITLKNLLALELNNMALHSCESVESVIENRKQLAASLSYGLNDFVFAHQTHSANFQCVTAAHKGRGVTEQTTAIPETDALYTYEPNIVLGTFTADCVPALFYNEVTGLVGVIHSGWQGTVKEITYHLFQHLQQENENNLRHIHVIIGPAISQKKFEVDQDVYEKFAKLGYANDFINYKEETNKYHIDNQLTVKKQCELAGISPERIQIERMCTFEDAAGFSYREDKKSGRHLGFVVRKS